MLQGFRRLSFALVIVLANLSLTPAQASQGSCQNNSLDQKIDSMERYIESSPETAMRYCTPYSSESICNNSQEGWRCTQLGGYYHCFRQETPYTYWCGTCLF